MKPEVVISIIGYIITIIVAIIGWVVGSKIVLKQVSIQHSKNIELEKERVRKSLEIRAAEEGLKLIQNTEYRNTDISVFLGSLVNDLKMEYKFNVKSRNWEDCPDKTMQYWNDFFAACLSFMKFYEANEMILYRFREMYAVIYDEVNNTREIESTLFKKIIEIYHFKYINGFELDHFALDELQMLINNFDESILNIMCYLNDFGKGLQNIFLSDVFEYQIPERRPTNSKYKVLAPLDK